MVAVDVVVGGFPCQPVSAAGRKAAQGDERWLWPEFERVIGALGPRLVFIENVPGLRTRGLVDVLRGLAALGYDAAWDGIPAAAVGAPHLRDRVWIAAWPKDAPPAGVPYSWEMIGCAVEVAAPRYRSGLLRDGEVFPTRPMAPVKTERREGWSYWTGVNLGESVARSLLPTPVVSDSLGSRNETCHRPNGNGKTNAGTTLLDALILMGAVEPPASAVNMGREVGQVLLPTPKAARYGSSQNGLNGVNGEKRRPSALLRCTRWRRARSGLRRSGRLLGGPVVSGKSLSGGGEGGTYYRTPSQKAGTHGLYLQSEVCEAEAEAGRARGPLNPRWVEWLMGFPLGWTDPECEAPELCDWHEEPLPRVLAGVSLRRQRLTALGNALVWRAAVAWIAAIVPGGLGGMRCGSLFSGVGAFDLAVAACGGETVWGCDQEPFVVDIFTRRFGMPVVPDVREIA